MKAHILITLAAGLIYSTPIFALPESSAIQRRGQCVSCGRGKSPPPSRPAPARNASPRPQGNNGQSQAHGHGTQGRTQASHQPQGQQRGQGSPRPQGQQRSQVSSRPQGQSSPRTSQASAKSGQDSSISRLQGSSGQASSKQHTQGASRPRPKFNLGDLTDTYKPSKSKDPSLNWETKRPPLQATVKMNGPGTIHVNSGRPELSGVPFKNQAIHKYAGPGPGEMKFSDPHKLEILANGKGQPISVSGTGGKVKAGSLFGVSEGSATAESKKDGKKELKLDPNSGREVQSVRVKAHEDETASGASHMQGTGAAWLDLSNSPSSTPPQSPRAHR